MNFHGRYFETVMGSDVQRDGMFLELREIGGKDCAEVIYSDLTHEFTVTMFDHHCQWTPWHGLSTRPIADCPRATQLRMETIPCKATCGQDRSLAFQAQIGPRIHIFRHEPSFPAQ